MHHGKFKQKISQKLKELGIESNHTDQYVKDMPTSYKIIYDASQENQLA